MDPFVKLARVPNRPPRVDILVAAGLLVWALLEAFVDPGPGPLAGRIAFAVAVSVPLAFRRQAPGFVVIVLSVATLARALSATEAEHGTMPFPSMLLAAFSVACYARQTVVAVAGGLLLLATMFIAVESNYYTGGGANASNLAILSLFFGGAWGAGWLVRQRCGACSMFSAPTSPDTRRNPVSRGCLTCSTRRVVPGCRSS